MKKIRSALAYVLLLAMLLSSMGGFAFGAGENIVSVGEQLVFDPLAETQSVAYERHTDGYEVTLDRAADGVMMRVTAVPKTVSAEGAALYIRTGVVPKAGKTYRVSYTLASEKALDEYAVCFDGTEENAYGTAEKRSVAAGGADLARCFLTPAADSGELVLRLLLGKTEVNTLRFSELAVEEATEEEVAAGANTVLVDKLDYAAPGAIRCAAEAGYSAEMTSTDTSATMSITNVPSSKDAAVWKLKLMVSTGLKPEPGKTYRFRATLNSTNSGSYEACYNEGEVEKGYDVLYNQSLNRGNQTIERMIYVPTDKENPGELIVQFSLGKLSKGTKVTISKVTVEEASPAYTNALAKDFALDKTDRYKTYDPNELVVTGSSLVSTNINWYGAQVWSYGTNQSNLSVDNTQVSLDVSECFGPWNACLVLRPALTLEQGSAYLVSFDLTSTQDYSYQDVNDKNNRYHVLYGWTKEDGNSIEEKGYNCEHYDRQIAASVDDTVQQVIIGAGRDLVVTLQLGGVISDRTVTVTNFTVKKIDAPNEQAVVTYAGMPEAANNNDGGSSDNGGAGYFGSRNADGRSGSLTFTADSATMTCHGTSTDGDWRLGLCIPKVCSLAGSTPYQISFDMQTTNSGYKYNVSYNRYAWYNQDGHQENYYGNTGDRVSDPEQTVIRRCVTDWDGDLWLRINLGKAPDGTEVTVSKFSVRTVPAVSDPAWDSGELVSSGFSSIYATHDGEKTKLEASANGATLTVTKGNTGVATWRAKLCIKTGVLYEEGKNYQVSFDIEAEKNLQEFCVITKGLKDPNADIRGTWGQSLSAGLEKTITTRPIPAGMASGAIDIDIELGKLDGNSNTFTVSNVQVYEVTGHLALKEARETGTVTNDMQEGYTVPLTRAKDSATVEINKTPSSGMEAWKHKLFIDTGVNVNEGEAYRVVFDTLAENDMDFEVCYNRGSTEKGFTAVYGLHAAAGKTKTVEKMVFAEKSGKLIVQLSLGNVSAPNKVTVSNFRVERVKYSYSGKSALPAEITYQAGDVTYWAHNDYAVVPEGSDDAITMNVKKVPSFGAEPWKIKLFLDTHTPLEPGKFYRVTTDLAAISPQNVEICYNSGGVEMGYDSMGGIRLAAGVKQTVEKLISVPADKTDGENLMLQVNLGAATSPNEITVSGVTVEEVSLRYADLMPQGFSYQKHSTVRTSPDIDAKLETTTGTASICITDAPATGAEVWMAQLLVRTGVVLTAGKSYVVRANLVSDKDLTYELCFNNEETEKGFDVLYGQFAHANTAETIDKKISVPAGMTDAGELVLQFSVGGPGANNVTVANVSVQELRYGTSGAKDLTPVAAAARQGAGELDVSREALAFRAGTAGGTLRISGANLRANDLYAVAFTGKADKSAAGVFTLCREGAAQAVMTERFVLSEEAKEFRFTTAEALDAGGAYELRWQFSDANVELSNVRVLIPAGALTIVRSAQNVTVNGEPVMPDTYNIDGSNYLKIRDLAALLNDTDAQFIVRYNDDTRTVSLTTGKKYMPIGGELVLGESAALTCVPSAQRIMVDGSLANLKAYNIGGYNFFRIRDLADVVGFAVDFDESTNTVMITSPLTPEAQEASYAYGTFFRPEIDSESQPYVGDPMAYYEDGVYYIYYLKEGGDSVNHSVYLTTTSDFASYTEIDKPVLAASRGDAQDSWIGTGSVTKVDGTYYFFYTGYNSSGAREYHEKIMVAKGSSPTSFEKVSGWEITPPASLGQKNDFRDPQAYYDPATGTISLTVTASQGGVARILKYTLNKDLTNAQYDGIIFTDPSGKYWNLECSDTFRLGDKWYLTYSGQEDTLWYAAADSRFGPYSAPVQLDGKVFYAAKHVEDGKNSYMVGWARRSETASSTQEVAAWGGNLAVQKLTQRADGSLALAPVDSVAASFSKPAAVTAESISLSAGSDYSFKQVCTSAESFKLTGEFTSNGTGAFGLAFDFNGKEESYKLISVDPKERTLSLAFNEGVTKIAETPAELGTKHSFTYIQDGSVGIFYVDGVASLTVRVYGSTGKPVYLFAQDGSVSFTSLRCFAK